MNDQAKAHPTNRLVLDNIIDSCNLFLKTIQNIFL